MHTHTHAYREIGRKLHVFGPSLFTVDAIDLGIIRMNRQYGSNEWDANQIALRIIWSELIKICSTYVEAESLEFIRTSKNYKRSFIIALADVIVLILITGSSTRRQKESLSLLQVT